MKLQFQNLFPKSVFESLISQVSNLSKQVEFIVKKLDCMSNNSTISKKAWVRKNISTCDVVHVAFKAKNNFVWYLHNG